ncbi:MAG: hypothetical protein V7L23_13260 [Nostoc sp.]|uniref:hypothetical protein n=1 Tax=Nostoc sp. TaxID=1180 RepID=UPI002FF0CF29
MAKACLLNLREVLEVKKICEGVEYIPFVGTMTIIPEEFLIGDNVKLFNTRKVGAVVDVLSEPSL